MKINCEEVEVVGNVTNHAESFKLDDSHMIFDILRNKLYSDPIESVAREVLSNARDANREIHNKKPIKVIANTANVYVSIIDEGPGISPERMYECVLYYGRSTKRNTNTQTGGWGLGFKSPFAICNTFSITTRHGGYLYEYSATLGTDNKGSLILISKIELPEKEKSLTGTEIRIPFQNTTKLTDFLKKCDYVTQYWPMPPKFFGFIPSPSPQPKIATENCLYFENDQRAIVLVDNIPTQLDKSYHTLSFILSGYLKDVILSPKLILKFKIGEIDLTPSREQIHFTERTKAAFLAKLKLAASDLEDYIYKELKYDPQTKQVEKVSISKIGIDSGTEANLDVATDLHTLIKIKSLYNLFPSSLLKHCNSIVSQYNGHDKIFSNTNDYFDNQLDGYRRSAYAELSVFHGARIYAIDSYNYLININIANTVLVEIDNLKDIIKEHQEKLAKKIIKNPLLAKDKPWIHNKSESLNGLVPNCPIMKRLAVFAAKKGYTKVLLYDTSLSPTIKLRSSHKLSEIVKNKDYRPEPKPKTPKIVNTTPKQPDIKTALIYTYPSTGYWTSSSFNVKSDHPNKIFHDSSYDKDKAIEFDKLRYVVLKPENKNSLLYYHRNRLKNSNHDKDFFGIVTPQVHEYIQKNANLFPNVTELELDLQTIKGLVHYRTNGTYNIPPLLEKLINKNFNDKKGLLKTISNQTLAKDLERLYNFLLIPQVFVQMRNKYIKEFTVAEQEVKQSAPRQTRDLLIKRYPLIEPYYDHGSDDSIPIAAIIDYMTYVDSK